ERAGCRACKRCRPTEGATDPSAARAEQARRWLDANADRAVTLAEVARAVGMAPAPLARAFTRLVGVTPKAYHAARRAERLRTELRKGETVSRAIFEAGYGSGSRVYERTADMLGMTPGVFKRGGAGVRVHFTI